jgi:hypothetical protein
MVQVSPVPCSEPPQDRHKNPSKSLYKLCRMAEAGIKRKERDAALTWEVPPAFLDDQELGGAGSSWMAAAETCRAGLSGAAEAHTYALVVQLLVAEGVGPVELWGPIVTRLAQQAAGLLSPQALATRGILDPRYYVKVRNTALN